MSCATHQRQRLSGSCIPTFAAVIASPKEENKREDVGIYRVVNLLEPSASSNDRPQIGFRKTNEPTSNKNA
jgi:hypothetical protein